MKLLIVSPEKKLYEGNIDYVGLAAFDGEIGILKNHAPLRIVSQILSHYEKRFDLDQGMECFYAKILKTAIQTRTCSFQISKQLETALRSALYQLL